MLPRAGTTATIAAVLQGRTLVTAAVGDSAALLMAREGKTPRTELLVEEHSPTNLPEYVRMQALPSGPRLKFVYDCPDFEEFDIFSNNAAGKAQLDADALRQADEHNVMLKNPRDDRFTLVIIPGETIKLSPQQTNGGEGGAASGPGAGETTTVVEEQAITMTRSLGDFYAHHHGVTWEPETRVLPLDRIAGRKWREPLLVLASDGVWDLWAFDQVAEELISPDNADPSLMATRCADFCEKTRAKGCHYFDEVCRATRSYEDSAHRAHTQPALVPRLKRARCLASGGGQLDGCRGAPRRRRPCLQHKLGLSAGPARPFDKAGATLIREEREREKLRPAALLGHAHGDGMSDVSRVGITFTRRGALLWHVASGRVHKYNYKSETDTQITDEPR